MATLTLILDAIMSICKLLGQVPDLYDRYQKYKQDVTYQGTSAKLEAALSDLAKAKHEKDIQAQLNALHTITSGGPK
jgi:hypothetical protein